MYRYIYSPLLFQQNLQFKISKFSDIGWQNFNSKNQLIIRSECFPANFDFWTQFDIVNIHFFVFSFAYLSFSANTFLCQQIPFLSANTFLCQQIPFFVSKYLLDKKDNSVSLKIAKFEPKRDWIKKMKLNVSRPGESGV